YVALYRVRPAFPTRRSSDLVLRRPRARAFDVDGDRLVHDDVIGRAAKVERGGIDEGFKAGAGLPFGLNRAVEEPALIEPPSAHQDRKSTRLNSSHVKISYAV